MGLRDIARKGLAMFVEPDAPPAPAPATADSELESDRQFVQQLRSKSVGDLLRELDGPEPEQIHQAVQAAAPAALSPLQDGRVDFSTVYRQAQISASVFGAEQAYELLQSFPDDMGPAGRHEAFEERVRSLGRAVSVTRETIVADTSRKLNALSAFEDATRNERDAAVAAAHGRMAELRAEIEAEERKIAAAEARCREFEQLCETEGERLGKVQEFLTRVQAKGAPPPAAGGTPEVS
jgi:hypothetical protein